MKITIKKGTSIEDTLNILSNFLNENFSDYTVLKNDMRVYINLKNEGNQICPDNEQEYQLSLSEPVKDVFKEKQLRAKIELMKYWDAFFYYRKKDVINLGKKIKLDNTYLETAAERGRKEENIAKRKIQLDTHERELKEALRTLELIELLDTAIKNNNYETHFIKFKYDSSYKYSLDTTFVFKDIEGYTGYFDDRGLHDGVPKY